MIMTKNDYEYVGIVLDIMYFEKREVMRHDSGSPDSLP